MGSFARNRVDSVLDQFVNPLLAGVHGGEAVCIVCVFENVPFGELLF